MIRDSFKVAGALLLGARATSLGPAAPSLKTSTVYVGGWTFPTDQVRDGINNSDLVKNMGRRLHFEQLGSLLKQYASTKQFGHLYLRVGDYDVHGVPRDRKTGHTSFANLNDATLQVLVLSPEEAAAEHRRHERECLPLTPLAVAPERSSTEILAHILDVASEINKKALPYEPANWRLFNPLYHPPANSNSTAAALAECVGAHPSNGSNSLASLYPECILPGIDRRLSTELKHIGVWFQEEVAKNSWKMEQLVEAFKNQMQDMFSEGQAFRPRAEARSQQIVARL